jgi:hypothetical protein
MSQSGRLTLNQPVPGAGIETITGNNGVGFQIHGDGTANVNIVGAGTINVAGDGTNTLTISSTGVPARYPTDDGTAVPDIGGNLTVTGGANINTDAIIANTVRISLDDDVDITGTFTSAGTITSTGGNIVADTGNITATAGNVTAGNQIVGTQGGGFGNTVAISAGGLNSTGPTILNSLNQGVVQVDNAHTLFSDGGTGDGQVLISSSVGAPAWSTITPGANITIANGNNSIQISAAAAVATTFQTNAGNATPVADLLKILGGSNINTSGSGNTVTANLNNDVIVSGIITATGNIGTAAGNFVADTGDFVATNGNITATNGTMHSANATVDGTTRLSSQLNGALVTNGIGNVTAVNGAAGQVLTANPGGSPSFQPAGGSGASISSFFARQTVDSGFITGNNTGAFAYLGSAVAMSTAPADCFNIGGNFFVGNGSGTPARYTAPLNGSYFFDFQTRLYSSFSGVTQVLVDMAFNNTTRGIIYQTSNFAYFVLDAVRLQYVAPIQWYIYMYLNAGDVVSFGIRYNTGSVISSVGVANTNSWISGHKVA